MAAYWKDAKKAVADGVEEIGELFKNEIKDLVSPTVDNEFTQENEPLKANDSQKPKHKQKMKKATTMPERTQFSDTSDTNTDQHMQLILQDDSINILRKTKERRKSVQEEKNKDKQIKELRQEINKLHEAMASMQKLTEKNEETEMKAENVQGINRQHESQRQRSEKEDERIKQAKDIELEEQNERKQKIKEKKEEKYDVAKPKETITQQMQKKDDKEIKELKEEINKLNEKIASMQKRIEENESKNEEIEMKAENVQEILQINGPDIFQRQTSEQEQDERMQKADEIELKEKQKEFEEKKKEKEEKDNYNKAKKTIIEQMQMFKDDANKIKNDTMNLRDLPLHKFTANDITNTIKCWKYNDIQYNKCLEETINIFAQRDLNSTKIRALMTDNIRDMVDDDLETFLSKDTIRIMFNEFDKLKKQHENENLSSVKIGYIIYHLPLNKLLKTIVDEEINGKQFVCQASQNFGEITGWNEEENVYQVIAELFINQTYQKDEFIKNMQKRMKETFLPPTTIKSIQETILKFDDDLELIHLNIRHGKRNDEFNDAIINMIDDLVEQNNHDIKENEDIDDTFVSKIYKLISACFMWNDYKIETDINEPSLRKYQWNCCNCGNVNFCAFVDSKINNNLEKCRLCGITQKDAIVLNLRNHNTFIMETNYVETEKDNYATDEKLDEIDKNIKQVIQAFSLDLICLNQNNNNSCNSIIRLAKCLIQYKEWLDRTHISVDDVKKIYKTINVDIMQYVDNDTYMNVIIECLNSSEKISNEQSKLFQELFGQIEAFFKICDKRKMFIKSVKEQTKIKPAVSRKLLNQIKAELMIKAHMKQFGTFLTNLKSDDIQNDYNHILKHHIYGGSNETKKNVFIFFQNVVHYTDKTTEKNACKSYKRRQLVTQEKNMNKSDSKNESQQPENTENRYKMNNIQDIWTSQQFYIQHQLDVMHSYLVHSDLKRMMQDSVDEYKHDDNIKIKTDDDVDDELQDEDKYISYGFGVGHEYPHLAQLRDSIRDELSYNSDAPLGDKKFQDLLIKAINKRKYGLKDYGDTSFCKYFDPEYNILRNEPVSIRHILALVLYTDLTHFCTVLRGTYRPKDNNEDEIGVTQRHREFYWYSRALFASVEFFGQEMHGNFRVYHGLKGSFQFDQFAAFFNQPISTTKAITIAQGFAGGSGGAGIILTLTSRFKNINDSSKVPKYLSVSWLSDHAHEEELLFHGSHVSFKIENITETDKNNRDHPTELSIFNKFQSTLQNECVKWNKNEISNLVELIQHEIHSEINEYKTEEKALFNNKCITDYGCKLFRNFCFKMTHISIKNFRKIPKEIFNVLFGEKKRISLINLVKLFPNVEEVLFNYLVLSSFVRESKQYADSVLDLLNEMKDKSNDTTLHKIQFQSVKPMDNKKIATLQKLASRSFAKLTLQLSEWRVKYRLQETHKLIFRDYQIIRIKDIKDCNQKQMIYLVQQICNQFDKLRPHKQAFVSWFKKNKIDGKFFANSGNQNKFVEAMLNANNSNQNENKLLKQPSKLLLKGLAETAIKQEFVEVDEDFSTSDVDNALTEVSKNLKEEQKHSAELQNIIDNIQNQNTRPSNSIEPFIDVDNASTEVSKNLKEEQKHSAELQNIIDNMNKQIEELKKQNQKAKPSNPIEPVVEDISNVDNASTEVSKNLKEQKHSAELQNIVEVDEDFNDVDNASTEVSKNLKEEQKHSAELQNIDDMDKQIEELKKQNQKTKPSNPIEPFVETDEDISTVDNALTEVSKNLKEQKHSAELQNIVEVDEDNDVDNALTEISKNLKEEQKHSAELQNIDDMDKQILKKQNQKAKPSNPIEPVIDVNEDISNVDNASTEVSKNLKEEQKDSAELQNIIDDMHKQIEELKKQNQKANPIKPFVEDNALKEVLENLQKEQKHSAELQNIIDNMHKQNQKAKPSNPVEPTIEDISAVDNALTEVSKNLKEQKHSAELQNIVEVDEDFNDVNNALTEISKNLQEEQKHSAELQNVDDMDKQILKKQNQKAKPSNPIEPFVAVDEDFSNVDNASTEVSKNLQEEQKHSAELQNIDDMHKQIEELKKQNQKAIKNLKEEQKHSVELQNIIDNIHKQNQKAKPSNPVEATVEYQSNPMKYYAADDDGDKSAPTGNSCPCVFSFFDKFKTNKSKPSEQQALLSQPGVNKYTE